MALGGDRVYLLDSDKAQLAVGPLANGALPMSHGMTRLQNRYLHDPAQGEKLAREMPVLGGAEADAAGLCTFL